MRHECDKVCFTLRAAISVCFLEKNKEEKQKQHFTRAPMGASDIAHCKLSPLPPITTNISMSWSVLNWVALKFGCPVLKGIDSITLKVI